MHPLKWLASVFNMPKDPQLLHNPSSIRQDGHCGANRRMDFMMLLQHHIVYASPMKTVSEG